MKECKDYKECRSCKHRGKLGTSMVCDYILIESQPRGCDIGDKCIRYINDKRKRKKFDPSKMRYEEEQN